VPRRGATAAVLAALGLLASGCSRASADTTLTIFAAASLTGPFEALAAVYEGTHPGVAVTLNFAASSALREQVAAGAPADVFASASTSDMDRLAETGALAAPARVFARNRMTIAVPAGNPAAVTGPADFADPDLLIGLCAEEVPCGEYARRALEAAGVVASLDSNEPDVRSLLTKIEAGELDAGIVYVTDVVSAGGAVEAIPLPQGAAVEATYPIAVLAAAPHPGAAADFMAFVLSPPGLAVLAAQGFLAP